MDANTKKMLTEGGMDVGGMPEATRGYDAAVQTVRKSF